MHYTLDFGALLSNDYPALILGGLMTTLKMTVLAWLLAFSLGSLLAILRMLNRRPLNYVIALYVAFHRNVPMLVHILLWYFGVAAVLPMANVRAWPGGRRSHRRNPRNTAQPRATAAPTPNRPVVTQ